MSLLSLIGFGGSNLVTSSTELPEIYPFSLVDKDFIKMDIMTIYSRILTDVFERTQNIPDEKLALLWDNCLASESKDGLVTLLAKAMYEKADLFLVYSKVANVVRKATLAEQDQIKKEYADGAKNPSGVYVTFKNFDLTEMLKIYSLLEYCTIGSLHKSMNLSKAVQVKIKELRSSIANSDASSAIAQAKQIAIALNDGKAVLIDGEDTIETAKPDLTASEASMVFINKKRSFYLGLPASWITGDAISGMSDTGAADAKSTERGLKGYYFSICKPVVEALFGIKTEFETEDYDNITSFLEVLKTFDITSDEYLSAENKQKVVNRMGGLPENTKGDKPKPTAALPPPADPKPPVA
jgi:hypothetical protein